MMELVRRRALVSGRVQGVGFRWFAADRAEHLGLTGWVGNLPDGRVEMVFQGPPGLVAEMEDWLRRGLVTARVRQAVFHDERVEEDEDGFRVR